MAKTAGGVRDPSGPRKGATEKGYTANMVKNIVGKERNIRFNKDESLHVFSETGKAIASVQGKGAEVNYSSIRNSIPQNSIMTHNHPRGLAATGIGRIGNSFSKADIVSAVSLNAKEIRAVTPTYTFSVKRPKGGWGGSAKEIGKAFDAADNKVFSDGKSYLNKTGWSNMARAEVTNFHKVMKIMAKKYGWDYSKKRN